MKRIKTLIIIKDFSQYHSKGCWQSLKSLSSILNPQQPKGLRLKSLVLRCSSWVLRLSKLSLRHSKLGKKFFKCLNPCFSILDTWTLTLEPQILIVSSIEDWVSNQDCQLTFEWYSTWFEVPNLWYNPWNFFFIFCYCRTSCQVSREYHGSKWRRNARNPSWVCWKTQKCSHPQAACKDEEHWAVSTTR